jgi:hypothetical protein
MAFGNLSNVAAEGFSRNAEVPFDFFHLLLVHMPLVETDLS